jgi:hypothetical protein
MDGYTQVISIMKQFIFLADTNLSWEVLGISAVCFIISLVIFYYITKEAVKNGVIEANNSMQFTKKESESRPDRPEIPLNKEQKSLQLRYEKGEITFEEYKSEWNKLGS